MSNKIYHSLSCDQCGAKVLAWFFRPVEKVICPACQSTMTLRDQRPLGKKAKAP